MFDRARTEALAVEAVCAEIAVRKAAGDFLTSAEAREITERVVLTGLSADGVGTEEVAQHVLAMFKPIRTHVVAQHAEETRASIASALRHLADVMENDSRSLTDDILRLEEGSTDIDLAWRLLSQMTRPRTNLQEAARGIPEGQRKSMLKEIERLSQILLLIAYRELDPA